MLRALPRAALLESEELERTTADALAAGDRPLGPWGHLALWGGLGAGLYLMVVGAWLVPALSIAQAVLATVLGAALGAALVAITVRLAAAENRSGVPLYGDALGERGVDLYGAMAIFRHVAWGAVQLAIAAQIAAALMGRQGLGGGQPLWAALFGALVLLMVLAGPAKVTRLWLVRVGGPLAALIAVGFAFSAWSDYGVPAYLQREPAEDWPTMTAAVDLVAVLALIWLPVAADLGRLGAPRRSGTSAFLGLGGMTAWFVLLGVLFVPAVSGDDLPGFLLATPLGVLALLVVLVLELDGAFVSLYALASTARGLSARVQAAPVALAGAGVLALGGALVDPFDFGDALLLLGAAFVPLLGAFLGVRAVRRLIPGTRLSLGSVGAWAVGFLLYNWVAPLEVPAWTAAMSAVLHDFLALPFPAGVPGLSATLLAFTASFALSGAGALAGNAEKARLLLLGPLAPRPVVRVEGASVEGKQGSPFLKLYVWVETPASRPVVDEVRLQMTWPFQQDLSFEVRERRHEERVLSFPLDTGGISPRLTLLANVGRPLPAVRGILEGRVASLAEPDPFVRWLPFQAIYRWDVQPPRPEEAGEAAAEAEGIDEEKSED